MTIHFDLRIKTLTKLFLFALVGLMGTTFPVYSDEPIPEQCTPLPSHPISTNTGGQIVGGGGMNVYAGGAGPHAPHCVFSWGKASCTSLGIVSDLTCPSGSIRLLTSSATEGGNSDFRFRAEPGVNIQSRNETGINNANTFFICVSDYTGA